MLERGKFDGIFFADISGVLDTYQGKPDAVLAAGAYVPVNDPLLLIPAIAASTTHLGFGVTANLMFDTPYFLARRFSTLDHLTKGRIAWNIVTQVVPSVQRATGLKDVLDHDRRYDLADEFMDIVYKLWEKSWDDDAVIRDRETGVYVAPDRVHKISHHGRYFDVEAIHICEPSPQRTPLLYQSGGSDRGKRFAAQHAECVFLNGLTTELVKDKVNSVSRLAVEQGRNARDIHFFANAMIIVAETEAEARRKLEDIKSHVSLEGNLALASAMAGVDFSKQRGPAQIREAAGGNNTTVRVWENANWTTEDVATHIGGRGCVVIGTPQQVCDRLQYWVEATGIDGFNLGRALKPGTMEDVVDMVVPELQKRGVYKREYSAGSYREKMKGSARPLSSHPSQQVDWR
jgi:long-chain alkane monooxygenase